MQTKLADFGQFNTAFDQQIAEICSSTLASASNLRSALQSCRGLFPTDAVSAMKLIDPPKVANWIENAKLLEAKYTKTTTKSDASFLLSTWEYSRDASNAFSSLVAKKNQRTCLLGAPTMADHLGKIKTSRPHLLFDIRKVTEELHDEIAHVQTDINRLNGTEYEEIFDLCILDPPWYLENYIRWIDVAGRFCRPGGKIAFSLLGELTRPSASSDRQQIIDYCRAQGLNLEIYRDAVLYDVPEFERHMLRRSKIPVVPWKRADLVIGTRDNWNDLDCSLAQPRPLRPFACTTILGVRIEIEFDRYDSHANQLLNITSDGYWMKTPSRRAKNVDICNVFTSNGAKFSSPRPIDLYFELKKIETTGRSIDCVASIGFPVEVFR